MNRQCRSCGGFCKRGCERENVPEKREWVGLTDEEIDRVTDQQWASNNHKPIYAAHRAYARAIEAALRHRLGEKA